MEFDEVVVKESPGLCRCCLSEGCYKDLGSEYSWMGDTEIYADMLLECFDIGVSQHAEGPNGPNRLICEVCITRLRDACNFKKQVLDSEKRFIDMLHRGDFKSKGLVFPSDMKQEAEALDVEYLDDLDFGDDAEDLLKTDTEAEPSQSEDITVASLPPVKRGRGRPRKSAATPVKPERRAKMAKLEDKPRSSKAAAKDDTRLLKTASTRRRRNLINIFNNTSLVPFKWRGKYICYYCDNKFSDPKLLRKHSKSHGAIAIRDRSLESQRKANVEVKLDVSEIHCEICHEHFETFEEIVHHLTFKHDLEYESEVASPIEPYRLSDLKCLVCGILARNFINLVSHMNNNHPRNNLPCEHCGQQFNKLRDLDTHKRNFHREGGYSCDLCKKSFTTNQRLKAHCRSVHLSRCEICLKQFSTLDIKNKHIELSHGDCAIKSEFPIGEFDECDLLEATHQDLNLRKEKSKLNRANIAIVLNMSTAIPFKYFKNQYLCFYCSRYFTECDQLREHTVTSHVAYNTKQKCTKALKGSEVHIKIDIAALSCKVCFESFNDLDSLIDHLIEKHNAKYDKTITGIMQPFKLARENMHCPICDLNNFNYLGTLLRHMNKVHSGNNYICDNCGEGFGSTLLLKSHLTRFHSDREFKCDICGLNFANGLKLETHRAKIHGIKCNNCPRCPESFLSDYAKRKHLMRVHNVGHKCTYCDRMFTKNSFMRSHIKRTHLKEKNVTCPVCHVKFFDNYILRQHMVKHIGDKNFHCDVCGKSFFWKKNLRGHMASHSKHSQHVEVQF